MCVFVITEYLTGHDDVIKWKHIPRYWLFVRGIHRSPVNSPHTGQWRGALMFSLICARIHGNGEADDLRRHRAHNDVIVMPSYQMKCTSSLYKTWLMTLYRESTCPGTAIVFAWTSPSIQNQTQLLLKLSLLKNWVDYSMQQHLNTPVRFNPCFSCLWCCDTVRFIFVC